MLLIAVLTIHAGAKADKQQPYSQEACGETCSPHLLPSWYCSKTWCSRELIHVGQIKNDLQA
jgi:hypothetical protein